MKLEKIIILHEEALEICHSYAISFLIMKYGYNRVILDYKINEIKSDMEELRKEMANALGISLKEYEKIAFLGDYNE